MAQYSALNRAQLSYEYLHTNSTTHEFLFGALAELVDNSRDAGATKMSIFTEHNPDLRGNYILCFLDDGEGMSPAESAKVIQFGHSSKRASDARYIGQYGNGLKSGAMRIGRDFVLFTKKGTTMTCVFLSRTFHESEDIKEIVVPLPSWNKSTKRPLGYGPELEKHRVEVDIILRHSPFHTVDELLDQFDKIPTQSGTLVMIYNLKLTDTGDTELDFCTDPHDILMDASDPNYADTEWRIANGTQSFQTMPTKPERRSFRAYTAVLYADPVMQIYIQDKKVRTKRLEHLLYKPRIYSFSSNRFKHRSEQEVEKAKQQARVAEEKAREEESRAREAEAKLGSHPTKEARLSVRQIQQDASQARENAKLLRNVADAKERSLKEPKTLAFTFGLNITNRGQDGMFIYNCSRLIKMYERVGPQQDGIAGPCSGVLGFVNVPYLVLEPTHNKQDFADAKEYRHLLKAMGEHLCQYWRDLGFDEDPSVVDRFWESFGYTSKRFSDPPSSDAKFQRKLAMQVLTWVQCCKCGKWRELPFTNKNYDRTTPDDWTCSDNPDPECKRCAAPEKKKAIVSGRLIKATKSTAEKRQETIEGLSRKLEALQEKEGIKVPAKRPQAVETSTAAAVSSVYQPVAERSAAKEATLRIRGATTYAKSQAQKKTVRKDSSSDDGEEADADDGSDDEVIPPPRKRLKTASQATPSRSKPTSTQPRKPHQAAQPPEVTSSTKVPVPAMSSTNGTGSDSPSAGDSLLSSGGYSVESRCEAFVNGCWYKGRVVRLGVGKDGGPTRVRVKFDTNSKDKYDKWFTIPSSDLRLLEGNDSVIAQTMVNETPSQATTASSASMDKIAYHFRTTLQYFLPPEWSMDKERVGHLSLSELENFPLSSFFDHYEKGLTKLIDDFRTQTEDARHEAEETERKLHNLRRMVLQLVRHVNGGDSGLNEGDVSENVDHQLQEVLNQVTAWHG